jgi:hypothetical protein
MLTILIFLSFALIFEKPEFSPTMSEEEKHNELRIHHPEHFTFTNQVSTLKKNSGFILVAATSIMMLVNVNEIDSVLGIFLR